MFVSVKPLHSVNTSVELDGFSVLPSYEKDNVPIIKHRKNKSKRSSHELIVYSGLHLFDNLVAKARNAESESKLRAVPPKSISRNAQKII